MSDDLVALAEDESFDAFKDVLQAFGTFDGESGADQKEKDQKEREDQ